MVKQYSKYSMNGFLSDEVILGEGEQIISVDQYSRDKMLS